MKTVDRDTSPEELLSLSRMIELLRLAQEDERQLPTIFPPESDSSLGQDNAMLPELSLPDFVHLKLVLAYGHLDAFRRWLGAEGDAEILSIQALPFGGYALLRPVLECAGEALWVMKPKDRQNRLRRRMTAHASEILNAASFLKGSKSPNQSQVEHTDRES